MTANDLFETGITLSIGTSPEHGTASVAADRRHVNYTPDPDYYGPDTFVYHIVDIHGAAAEATVSITVVNVNDPPTVRADAFDVAEDSSDNHLSLLQNDSFSPDPEELLTITAVGATDQGGTVTIAPDGSYVIYAPAPDFFGTDSFTYTVTDAHGGSASTTVTVNVDNRNDPPTAGDDAFTMYDDGTAQPLDVVANDSIAPDVDETLLVIAVTAPAHGTALMAPHGDTVFYKPEAKFAGVDEFAYTISDGHGGTAVAQVVVTVRQYWQFWQNPRNAADVNDDDYVTPLDALLVINYLNTHGAGALPKPSTSYAPPPFYDVYPDGFVAPSDALQVINQLNQGTAGGEGEAWFNPTGDAAGSQAAFGGAPGSDAAMQAPWYAPAWANRSSATPKVATKATSTISGSDAAIRRMAEEGLWDQADWSDLDDTLDDLAAGVARQPATHDLWDEALSSW